MNHSQFYIHSISISSKLLWEATWNVLVGFCMMSTLLSWISWSHVTVLHNIITTDYTRLRLLLVPGISCNDKINVCHNCMSSPWSTELKEINIRLLSTETFNFNEKNQHMTSSWLWDILQNCNLCLQNWFWISECWLHMSVIWNDFLETRDMSGCVTFLSEWSEMSPVSDHHKYWKYQTTVLPVSVLVLMSVIAKY